MNGNKREKNTQRKQYVLVRSLTIFSRPFNFLSLFVGALFIKSNEWILVSIFLPYFSISRTIIYIYIYRRIHSHKPSFHLATTLTFFFLFKWLKFNVYLVFVELLLPDRIGWTASGCVYGPRSIVRIRSLSVFASPGMQTALDGRKKQRFILIFIFWIISVFQLTIGGNFFIFFIFLFFSGCFLPPPYVDAYGETDQGLRRGDPLHICDASRRKLELLWRSHGLYNEAAKYM